MKKLYWIVPLFLAIALIISLKLFLSDRKQKTQTTIFEFGNGGVGESMDLPVGKYLHGFSFDRYYADIDNVNLTGIYEAIAFDFLLLC
jgi:hypothetical protein